MFDRFCNDLHVHLAAYADRSGRALFMARGGLRLRLLYETHLNRRHLAPALPIEDFYISRIAAAKAALLNDFEYIAPLIIQEFRFQPLSSVLTALLSGLESPLSNSAVRAAIANGHFDLPATIGTLKEALFASSSVGNELRTYFADQRQLFSEIVSKLRGPNHSDHLIVVDTGWSGSTQAMLQRSFPQITWRGLYFGRYNYGKPWLPHFRDMVGIVCQDGFRLRDPATSFFLYRHLVESVCEVPSPSVLGYERNSDGAAQPAGGPIREEIVRPGPADGFFGQILEYVAAAGSPDRVSDIVRSSNRAAWRLMRVLMFPSRAEVKLFSIPPCSADFGRDISYPAQRAPASWNSPTMAMRNVSLSLWPEGQIALEVPWLRLPLQLLLALVRPHAKRVRQAQAFMSRAVSSLKKRQ